MKKIQNFIIISAFRKGLWVTFKNLNTLYKEWDFYETLLDFPLEDCLLGAESRIGIKRNDLPWIEEKLDAEFKQVIIDFPKKKLPHIYELIEKYKINKNIIIFKTREETDNYLKILERQNT